MRIHDQQHLLVYLPLAALGVCGCRGFDARSLDAARRIVEVSDRGIASRPAIAEAVARLEPRKLTRERLKSWPAQEVETARSAAADAAFYFPEDEGLVLLEERAFEEKLARGGAATRDFRDLFKGYMSARMFDKAKALRMRFPGQRFPSMPDRFTAAAAPPPGRPVYAVADDWRSVELTAAAFGPEVAVVMSMFPGCPAAESATEDLLADPRTARILRKKALLLTERFDAEGVWEWRRKFDLRAFYIVRRPSDFPEISFDASPTFYFLRDGVVISSMTGWGGGGPEGSRREWLAALAKAAR